ncbi:MAG: 1-deoxy-D-xylulose-5-phosphate reductoisomerase [Pseudomonadales bacterium]|nr:1-deoxy-D-xylulose-5-phosphate reductoisomerase [Pseudomonadales bacterium]
MTSLNSEPIGVTVLGSTGSVGVSTLDVIARHPQRYRVHAITAHSNAELLAEQCLRFKPKFAVLSGDGDWKTLRNQLATQASEGKPITQVLVGVEGLNQVSVDADAPIVMAAIVGAAGLLPTLAAVREGKKVLLANKESLVMTGSLMMGEMRKNKAQLIPIDSEHNAIFQCLPHDFLDSESSLQAKGIRKLLLTGSGGPFRTVPTEALKDKTPDEACNHPNWDMGRKISVDSATMMNKGLEFIEACWMFDVTPDQVQVVIHPQSIIHSMVEYVDGSIIAQMGNPDMRIPIAYGLSWPERIESGVDYLDLIQTARFDFEAPDYDRFPCLQLAKGAMKENGTAPAVLNAANEVAVQAFLDCRIRFTDIHTVIDEVLNKTIRSGDIKNIDQLETVINADQVARVYADEVVTKY